MNIADAHRAAGDLDRALAAYRGAVESAKLRPDDDPLRGDASWPRSWLGARAELTLEGPVAGVTTARRLALAVAGVSLAELDGEDEIYHLELVDRLAPLGLGLGTRKFANARTEDIVAMATPMRSRSGCSGRCRAARVSPALSGGFRSTMGGW